MTPPKKEVYVSFSAEVNPTSTEGLLRACSELSNKGADAIHLMLTTPGGSVMHGFNIFHVLRALPCEIVTYNVGAVNSIGNVVFLAGDRRYAAEESTFMFHGVGFNVDGKVRLDERVLVERLDGLRADQRKIAQVLHDRASFPDTTEIEKLFLNAATGDAQFAKDRGIIDEIRQAKVPKGTTVIQLVFQR